MTAEQTEALSLLKENGVNETTAASLVKDFPPQRVIKNVKLARDKHKSGKAKDLGAVTVAAIREDWSNQAAAKTPLEQAEEDKKRHHLAANERREKEKKQLENLESTFHQERRRQIKELITGWNEETFKAELKEFEKTTDNVTRGIYKEHGLNSRFAKAAFMEYVARKYLSPTFNDFVTWARTRGHEIEGNQNGGYRVRSTKSIGTVLKKVVPKIDELSR